MLIFIHQIFFRITIRKYGGYVERGMNGRQLLIIGYRERDVLYVAVSYIQVFQNNAFSSILPKKHMQRIEKKCTGRKLIFLFPNIIWALSTTEVFFIKIKKIKISLSQLY